MTMSPDYVYPPVLQCLECSTLFLRFVIQKLGDRSYRLCPNPNCNAPSVKSEAISDDAVRWYFNHILGHSGIDEVRRMNLRVLAEAQMGPWQDEYRHY